MTTPVKKELRIYATSAVVANPKGDISHSVYAAVSISPQEFMRAVADKFMAQFPLEHGYRYHGYAPPVEVSREAIGDVIASWGN